MKKLLSVLLATLMLALSATALADTLVMGTNASFPPFEFIGDDGQPTGFDVEIGAKIAEKMGMDFKVEDMAFDGLITALETGIIDMAIAGMTITEEKKEQVLFSDPYFNAQQQVIVRADYEDIQSLDDLKDKVVAVQEGTTGHVLVSETLGLPDNQIISFKSANDAILELKAGRADCVVIDTAPANVFVAENDDLKILDGIETEKEEYGIAIKKDNPELLETVNAVLAEMKEDGSYDALVAKYFTSEE